MTHDIQPQSAQNESKTAPEEPQTVTRIPKKKKPLLHPWAAGLILGLDWLLFSGTFFSGGSAVLATMSLGFITALIGTVAVQWKLAGDSGGIAALKGIVAGLVVGAPFPIGGTILGGAILTMAGIDSLRGLLTESQGEN